MKTGSLRRILGYTFRYKWSFLISVVGFIMFAAADIAADAADTEKAKKDEKAAAAAADITADAKKAKRKQQQAASNKRARKKAKDK